MRMLWRHQRLRSQSIPGNRHNCLNGIGIFRWGDWDRLEKELRKLTSSELLRLKDKFKTEYECPLDV